MYKEAFIGTYLILYKLLNYRRSKLYNFYYISYFDFKNCYLSIFTYKFGVKIHRRITPLDALRHDLR